MDLAGNVIPRDQWTFVSDTGFDYDETSLERKFRNHPASHCSSRPRCAPPGIGKKSCVAASPFYTPAQATVTTGHLVCGCQGEGLDEGCRIGVRSMIHRIHAASTRLRLALFCAASVFCVTAAPLHAADTHWRNPDGGTFSIGGNWNDGVPGVGDVAHFGLSTPGIFRALATLYRELHRQCNQQRRLVVEDDRVVVRPQRPCLYSRG